MPTHTTSSPATQEHASRRGRKLTVRFSDVEYSVLANAAGGNDVSSWVRTQIVALHSKPLAWRVTELEQRIVEASGRADQQQQALAAGMAGVQASIAALSRSHATSQAEARSARDFDQKVMPGIHEAFIEINKKLSLVLRSLS